MEIMLDLFQPLISKRRVRQGVIAYKYRNGTIVILGQKYVMHSMTSAIKQFRRDFPAKQKQD